MSLVLDYSNGVFAAKPTGGSVGTDPASIGDANFADVTLLLHMDGSSGGTTFADSSGNCTIAANDTATNTSVKKFGTASAYFSANSSYLYVSSATTGVADFGSDDFTVEMFVYRTTTGRDIFFDTRQNTQSTGYFLVATPSSGNTLQIDINGTTYNSTATIATNQWVHIAASRESGTVRGFIDGTLVSTNTDNTSITDGTNGTYPPLIGATGNTWAATTTANMDGYIDELRITKGVARYTSNFTAPTAAFLDTGPTLDLSSGNTFVHAPSANVAYAFSNPPASGTAIDFTLKVTPSSTVTITWPSSVKWAGGTAPSSPASGETDAFTFYSTDGGTSYYGFQAGDAYS